MGSGAKVKKRKEKGKEEKKKRGQESLAEEGKEGHFPHFKSIQNIIE